MAERRPPVAHSEALSTAPSPSTEDPASLLTPTSDVPLIMTPSDAADLSAQSTSTGHSTTDDLTLTLALVKQFTNLVHRAPFLAPAAALTYEILKAYHDTNEPRDVLPVTITDLARNLCGTILRLEATNHFDLLGRLEADVETYTVLLTKASAFIQNYNDQGIMSHVAARNALETKFTTLTRELNSFGARFRNNRLVDLAMNQNVDAQTLDKVHTMVLEEKLEKWLESPPNMKRKQLETQKLRQGTGLWLLEGDTFIRWQDNPGSLWIQGPSGTGKSVLSWAVISKLIDDGQLFKDMENTASHPALAFFHFDSQDKQGQSVETALRRITLQLSAQSPHPYRALDEKYRLSNGQALPTYQDLLKVLKELLLELGRTYIVLDALDECSDLEHLLELISVLRSWSQTPVHLLITSQPRSILTEYLGDVPRIVLESPTAMRPLEDDSLQYGTSYRLNLKSGSPLHLCCREGYLEGVSGLLANPVDVNLQNEEGTPLQIAALRGHTDIVRLLLANAADINARDGRFGTALQIACVGGRTEIVRLLLENGAHIDARDRRDGTALQAACAGRRGEIIRLLLKNGADIDVRDNRDGTALQAACADGHAEIVRLLLDEGADINATGGQFGTVLYAACTNGHAEIVRLLLDEGADINATGGQFGTSLQAASAHGLTEIVRLLLDEDADINATGEQYGTAIQVAAACGHTEIVHLLLDEGADINATGGQFGTAIQVAAARGHTDIVRLLLGEGADANKSNGDSPSALQAACAEGNTEIIRLLVENGADVKGMGGRYSSQLLEAILLDNGPVDDLAGIGASLKALTWIFEKYDSLFVNLPLGVTMYTEGLIHYINSQRQLVGTENTDSQEQPELATPESPPHISSAFLITSPAQLDVPTEGSSQVGLRVNDFNGRQLSIPLELCRSWTDLCLFLDIFLRGDSESHFITSGNFGLRAPHQDELLSRDTWDTWMSNFNEDNETQLYLYAILMDDSDTCPDCKIPNPVKHPLPDHRHGQKCAECGFEFLEKFSQEVEVSPQAPSLPILPINAALPQNPDPSGEFTSDGNSLQDGPITTELPLLTTGAPEPGDKASISSEPEQRINIPRSEFTYPPSTTTGAPQPVDLASISSEPEQRLNVSRSEFTYPPTVADPHLSSVVTAQDLVSPAIQSSGVSVPLHVQVIRRRKPVQQELEDPQATFISTDQALPTPISIITPSQYTPETTSKYLKLFHILYTFSLFTIPNRYSMEASKAQALDGDEGGAARSLYKRWINEWTQIGGVAGLIFSVLFTILQISSASYDPIVRTVVQLSIVCLFFGAAYAFILVMAFGKLESESEGRLWMVKVIRASPENTFWNAWIMLAMPLVWIVWGVVYFAIFILAFLWRAGASDVRVEDSKPSPNQEYGPRAITTLIFVVGVAYLALIIQAVKKMGS